MPALSDLKVKTTQSRRFNVHQCAFNAALADYERMDMIGRSNAEVFRVRCRYSGAVRAVKVYSNDGDDPCKQEYQILQTLDHPGIPKVHQFYRGVRNSAFVMDFVEGTNLEAARRSGPLTLANFLKVAQGLLTVLSYVHSNGLAHRDISCDNVMFDPATGKLSVIDWNIAREYMTTCDGERTVRTVRAHSPTNKRRSAGEELAGSDCTDTNSPCAPLSPCSDFSDYGKPSYREPTEWEAVSLPDGRDLYAAGVVLRMLSRGLPGPLERVVQGLLAEPSSRFTAEAALKCLDASEVSRVTAE